MVDDSAVKYVQKAQTAPSAREENIFRDVPDGGSEARAGCDVPHLSAQQQQMGIRCKLTSAGSHDHMTENSVSTVSSKRHRCKGKASFKKILLN